jgi:hypothetical protein
VYGPIRYFWSGLSRSVRFNSELDDLADNRRCPFAHCSGKHEMVTTSSSLNVHAITTSVSTFAPSTSRMADRLVSSRGERGRIGAMAIVHLQKKQWRKSGRGTGGVIAARNAREGSIRVR